MALLLFSPLTSLSSSLPFSSPRYVSTMVTTAPSPRLHGKSIGMHQKAFNRSHIHTRLLVNKRSIIVKASSSIDGTGPDSGDAPTEGVREEVVPVENLPLESKLQLKLEQKLRMKMAKKIRLRRKRLVRKRQLRKKGRWPPSKMKKNKNV